MTGGVPFDQIAELAKLWGAPGAVIIILGWRLWQLEKERAVSFRERLADQKEIGQLLRERNVVDAELVISDAARVRAQETVSEAAKLQTSAIIRQTEAIGKLSDSQDRMQDGYQRLLVALSGKGLRWD